MTTPSDDQPPEDRTGSSGAGSSRPEGAPGVELGMSDESGGTFEPEEDVEPDD